MIIDSSFSPCLWLNNCHLQTLWPPLTRARPEYPRERQRIDLKDGDFLDLDWSLRDHAHQCIVIILHGLTGSSESNYAWGLQHQLYQRGTCSVIINFRGCSGEFNRLPRGYHSGDTVDFDFICRLLKQHYNPEKLLAVGYSMGGNVLLKWLGEQGSSAVLNAAVAVSVPFRLDGAAQRLQLGFSKVYRDRFINDLTDTITSKISHFQQQSLTDHAEELKRLGDLSKIGSLWEFDDQVTAPLHGFKDAADFYQQSSSRSFIPAIKTETLILHAIDDPVVCANSIPTEKELPKGVTLELSKKGGHVGFVSSQAGYRPDYWLERRIIDYFKDNGWINGG